jgi:hypothetical protein
LSRDETDRVMYENGKISLVKTVPGMGRNEENKGE